MNNNLTPNTPEVDSSAYLAQRDALRTADVLTLDASEIKSTSYEGLVKGSFVSAKPVGEDGSRFAFNTTPSVPSHVFAGVEDGKAVFERIKGDDWDFYEAESSGLAGGGSILFLRDRRTGKLQVFRMYEGSNWAGDADIKDLTGKSFEEAQNTVVGWNDEAFELQADDTHIPTYTFRPLSMPQVSHAIASMIEDSDEESGDKFPVGYPELFVKIADEVKYLAGEPADIANKFNGKMRWDIAGQTPKGGFFSAKGEVTR